MLFSHQWMIREFISSKGWLKQRSFFSLSVIRLECQLHPKSNISILFANFLLLSVIMHRHQSSLLAVFAILVPLFAAVRCYWGLSGDNNLFSVYLYCYAPLYVWVSSASDVWPRPRPHPGDTGLTGSPERERVNSPCPSLANTKQKIHDSLSWNEMEFNSNIFFRYHSL